MTKNAIPRSLLLQRLIALCELADNGEGSPFVKEGYMTALKDVSDAFNLCMSDLPISETAVKLVGDRK
jgi:hypothetical protein